MSSSIWWTNINTIITSKKISNPGPSPGPGKSLCRDIVEKLAPDFLLLGANFFVDGGALSQGLLTGAGYVGLSVFWQFESLDGDLKERFLF
jgi:hypothetical protein